jgi:quercetin dioxygenase-like cupin family protein
MRSVDTTGLPAAPAWSDAELVELTIRLAADALVANQPARVVNGSALVPAPAEVDQSALVPALAAVNVSALVPAPGAVDESALVPAPGAVDESALVPAPGNVGPLTGRVGDRGAGVLGLSTAPAAPPAPAAPGAPVDRPWSVPLLVTSEVEAWLLGWPAGLVTPAHDHGRATVALTVVEGSLSEECLDPTIWTTGRRTTWRAGSSTLFPPGHVHLLGPAGGAPAVAVHAWSGPAGSGGRGAGRLAFARGGAAGGRGPGRGRGPAEPVGVGGGRGDGCRAGHPAHRALDLEHVRDRVTG